MNTDVHNQSLASRFYAGIGHKQDCGLAAAASKDALTYAAEYDPPQKSANEDAALADAGRAARHAYTREP